MTIKFVFERETKNTVRYAEEPGNISGPTVIGALYVQKDALRALKPSGTPDILFVEITAV